MEEVTNHGKEIANNKGKTRRRRRTHRRHRKKASTGAQKLRSLIEGAAKATKDVQSQSVRVSNAPAPPLDSMDIDELVVDEETVKPKAAKPQPNRKLSKDKRKTYIDHPNVVFVGNVPLAMDKTQLIRKMQIDPKIVKSVHFRSLPVESKFATNKRIGIIRGRLTDAKASKNAYITVVDEKHVDEVLAKNTTEVDGHYLFVNKASPSSFSKFNRKKTVFVGRLPPSTTENELYDVFSNVALVKDIRIIRDPKTFESKGFGFVAFDTRTAVPEAIEAFNNKEFKGYTLHVMKALDHEAAMEHKTKNSKKDKSSQKKTIKPPYKGKRVRKKK